MDIIASLSDFFQSLDNILINIIITIFVILLFFILNYIAKKILNKKKFRIQYKYRLSKFLSYFFTFISLVIIIFIWTPSIKSISTFLGLLSAGLAISLKEPITNVAGWLFILLRRPFEVADRIEIGQTRGDIIDIRLFQFTILEIGNWVDGDQSTGRIIHIPNGKILTEMCSNYSKGFHYIWDEISVTITFESDWKKAKEILTNISVDSLEQLSEAAEKRILSAAKKFMIFYKKLTPKVYTSVIDHGVKLTLRYLCEPKSRRTNNEKLWEEILEKFNGEKDINFAYPTTRFYKQP